MVNYSNKNQLLDCFIANINCIADDKYQERVWVRTEGPECDDIDNTVCDFFDEDYILNNYKDYGITEIQYNLLMKLHKKLRVFTDTFEVYSSEKSTKKLIQIPQ